MIVSQHRFNCMFSAVQEWRQGAITGPECKRRCGITGEEWQRLQEWIQWRQKTGAPLGRTIYLALGIEGSIGSQ